MNCPNCNQPIPEGGLICEGCGTEIQIVPDFEADVEAEITRTMNALIDEEEENTRDEDNPFLEDEVTQRMRRKISFILILSALVIGSITGLVLFVVHRTSAEYMRQKADSVAQKGNYQEAIAYIDKAQAKEPSDPQYLFLEAEYQQKLGELDKAIALYHQIIEANLYGDNDVFLAYDKLIKVYKEQERFQEINGLLSGCQYESIVSTYQNYLANKPEASVPEGIYDEVISLKLNANTSGKIYYTLDGTQPTENSQVYNGPIQLESGEYVVKAFFVNVYGIKSELMTKTYEITLTRPEQPVVSLESGVYNQAAMISVTCESGCRIFYTTDGTVPTMDSVPYTGAIPMPLGTTHFQFVAMNNAGICSEPLIKSYDLQLENSISTTAAVSILLDALVEKGYLLDRNGHKENTVGRYTYVFSSVIHATDGCDYYTINELYDDGTGMPVRTDVVYLTGVYSGEVYRLGFNDVGRFAAIPF